MMADYELIADGLAGDGYAVIDGFLSPTEVRDIVEHEAFSTHSENFKKAGIGKSHHLQINESIRGDYIKWIDKTSAPLPVRLYLDRLYELSQFLNRNLFLSIKDQEVHLTVYPAGAFYKRHLDQFKKNDHRILSVICYLNTGWLESNGGQLRMHPASGSVDVLPFAGRLVCFRSDLLEHEVLPSNRDRLSLTGWLLDQHKDLAI